MTTPCDQCAGVGILQVYDWEFGKTYYPPCNACKGTGRVKIETLPLGIMPKKQEHNPKDAKSY